MSGGPSCCCEERAKPLADRQWRVIDRNCNYSKFNGSRYTPSDYSAIKCLQCGRWWRTKAKYVDSLRDGTRGEVLS